MDEELKSDCPVQCCNGDSSNNRKARENLTTEVKGSAREDVRVLLLLIHLSTRTGGGRCGGREVIGPW